jgi:4-hydroxymandelate oxidase
MIDQAALSPRSGIEKPAIPPDTRCAADYARLAPGFMAPALFAHIDGGSGHDATAAANLAALHDCAIVPRVLRPVHHGDTSCTIGSITRPHPIMLAPLGWLGSVHPDAERAVAAAASATQSCLIASTMSSLTLEDIASAARTDRWFQLYLQPDRAVTVDLVRRAEAAGYTAIVVTVDAPIQIPSYRAAAAGFRPESNPANLRNYPGQLPPTVPSGESVILNGYMRNAPTWEDIAWLAQETDLPVWVKGVLHGDDAKEALANGATGVVVSNHGGRGLDGAPSSLSRLAGIRTAVGPSVPLLFDGGIRSGTDVFKAIALGADAVLIGRLQAYGLAAAGALGVGHVIKLLRQELEVCMALAGCPTLADVREADVILEARR